MYGAVPTKHESDQNSSGHRHSLKGAANAIRAQNRMQHMRTRIFLDPAPAPVADEEVIPPGAETEFKYLDGSRIRIFTSVLRKGVEGFEAHKILIFFLIVTAILADGLRPIALVWAKDGNRQYPFFFSTWIVIVKISVVIFSFMLYFSSRYQTDLDLTPRLTWRRKFVLSFILLPPTLCYLASDLLNFFLFEHISATTFAVVKQSRIVLTAILFRFLLHRSVSMIQWIAVIQLTLASTLFVGADMLKASPPPATTTIATANATMGESDNDRSELFGVMLLLLKCFIDALAVIWMDFFFKKFDEEGFPYTEQQIVCSLQSLLFGIIYFLAADYGTIQAAHKGLFDGYTTGAWVSAALAGFYGMLVSLLLRWTDSMIKMVQALLSVVVTVFIDWKYFGEDINIVNGTAIIFILVSVFLYKVGAVQEKGKHH